MRRLITLTARGNRFNGSLPQQIIDGLTMLNTLNLGFNRFTGSVPSFPHAWLRHLHLDNNHFSGDVEQQLLSFSLQQATLASAMELLDLMLA